MSKNYNKYYNKQNKPTKTEEEVKETAEEVEEAVEEVEETSEEVEETIEEVEETIEEDIPEPIKLATVIPDLLNFRSQPTVEDGNVKAVLKKGTDVEFVFNNGVWSTVIFNGERGYVMSKHIQLRDEE